MAEAGIRELRNHLSRYLDRVRGGEEVVVTDRGTPIARLIPVDERPFDRLVREGRITPPRSPRRHLPPAIAAGGTVSDLVGDQRR